MRSLLTLLLLLPIWSLAGETVLQRLNKTFAPSSQLTGNYQQTRFVKHLGVTLNSSGKFSMKKNGGISWEQTKPFASALNISEKEISFTVEGSPIRVIGPDVDPVLYSFGRAFLTLLKGDESALQAQFDVKEDGPKNKWHLNLTPKSEMIKKAIRGINIYGDSFVKSVRIEDQGDNYMKIDFQNIHTLGSAK